MTKYKVNINRPNLSTEEIVEQKDFNIVLKKYNKKSRKIFKTNWMIIYIIILVVIIGVFLAVRIIRDISDKGKKAKNSDKVESKLLQKDY